MVLGTALNSSSYPVLSIPYRTKKLRPVVAVNLVSLVILLAFLMLAVVHFLCHTSGSYLGGRYGLFH